MPQADLKDTTVPNPPAAPEQTDGAGLPRRHRTPRWLRVTGRVLLGMFLLILMLPVLVYLPPVQKLLKNVACDQIYKATGMKAGIDRFRLRFPIDVELAGVYILDPHGDTMVRARSAIADVRLIPLLHLDIDIKRLDLNDGYYRMVSADSSMIMRIRAGLLSVDGGSGMNLKTMHLTLNDARLENGDVSLYMNVWKKKPQPSDTTASPFLIQARRLRLKNFRFAMSMLPTIDTLDFHTQSLELHRGVIDLGRNLVSLGSVAASGGTARYLTPTTEYVRTHPAPVDTVSPPSPPMTIKADTIRLDAFAAEYGVKGHKPLPGFDSEYMSFNGLNLTMAGFFNRADSVRLPITRLQARERCGLQILEGSGTVGVSSAALTLSDLKVATPYSMLGADADVSFAMMAIQPKGPVRANILGRVGLADVRMFMPSLRPMLAQLPDRYPLEFRLDAAGSLAALRIPNLTVAMRNVVSLKASGDVANILKPEQLAGRLRFDGNLADNRIVDKVLARSGVRVPSLRLYGTAEARGKSYTADITMLSRAGRAAAKGHVSLSSEGYQADVSLSDLDVTAFMPTAPVGRVTAHLTAAGAGFNPESPSAHSDIHVNVERLQYSGHEYGDITADLTLADGELHAVASSLDPLLDFDINATGTIHPDQYDVDLQARLNHVNLYELGITKDVNSGSGVIELRGTASPRRGLYDLNLALSNVDWNLPGQYIHLPGRTTADFTATATDVALKASGRALNLDFRAASPLNPLIATMPALMDAVSRQIDARDLNVEELQHRLPRFDLRINASSRGILSNITEAAGIGIDTLYVGLHNDSTLHGFAGALGIRNESMKIDSVYLSLRQRDKLMDYRAHIGNRPGTLDEFADVSLRGYFGGNRASAFLTQRNVKGEQGYRLGLTAAFMDSLVSVHFTPLSATIGYKPWKINEDNHVDYYWNRRIEANLAGTSGESSINLQTVPSDHPGETALEVNLKKIYLQDFLQMSAFAPPVSAEISADMKLRYRGNAILGGGNLTIADFSYDKKRVGTFGLDFKAGMGSKGYTGASLNVSLEGKRIATLRGRISNDSIYNRPMYADVILQEFPLSIANPFLGDDVARLGGRLDGKMNMTGTMMSPHLNGSLQCDSVTAYVPMAGTTLRFASSPITVDDNLLRFKNFYITAANSNPLSVEGSVNARNIRNILIDLKASAANIQLVGGKSRKQSPVYGKLFLNLDASARGPLSKLDIDAALTVLPATDVAYTLTTSAQQLTQQTASDVVKFVNFSDTTAIAKTDTVGTPSVSMRVDARLTIINGAQITVNLSDNAQDRVQIAPSANLTYHQSYMGDMRLNGLLTLGEGFARYNVPVMGEKKFTFDPESYIRWNGDLMNPLLHISAVDRLKANVKQTGANSRLINFLVTLNVANNLSSPKVSFDLSTNDDLTVQNELESMTPEQRSQQAMNLLLYNTYTGPDTKASSSLGGNPLYSFLESQLNSWTANHIRGIDLSFGIDQYDKTVDGKNSTTTSYSYQLSKSLFSNRFKISVGGNYSTDANADENFAENLVNDISFEYMIKQTASMSMYARLFRHVGYESILEGEVTETGVGLVMKRKLGDLRRFFRFRRRKKRNKAAAAPADSTIQTVTPILSHDSL